MDSSVSLEDRIWFLRVCHHVPFALYKRTTADDSDWVTDNDSVMSDDGESDE